MTTSQALSIINHWLHPHPADNETALLPNDAQKSEQPIKSSSGCAGYQVGTGTILHQQQKLVEQVNEQLNLPDRAADSYLTKHWIISPTGSTFYLLTHSTIASQLEPVRHALETAFWSIAAMQQIHRDHDLYPDQRRAREPLWRLMAGVAGLLYDSGRMTSCLIVQQTIK